MPGAKYASGVRSEGEVIGPPLIVAVGVEAPDEVPDNALTPTAVALAVDEPEDEPEMVPGVAVSCAASCVSRVAYAQLTDHPTDRSE